MKSIIIKNNGKYTVTVGNFSTIVKSLDEAFEEIESLEPNYPSSEYQEEEDEGEYSTADHYYENVIAPLERRLKEEAKIK